MYKHKLIGRAFLFGIVLHVLVIGITPTAVSAGNETEILNITVGKPTKLSDRVYQNTSNLMASRTGVVAAFYPKRGTGPKFYRISTDRGNTWSPEMNGPPELGGGADSGTLRDGGVIMPASDLHHAKDGQEGWFEMQFLRFSDDMLQWKLETARLHMPLAGPPSVDGLLPGMAKGKMVQLPNGDVLAPMYGGAKGDSQSLHRSMLVRSKDQGRTWDYYGSIAYEPNDPSPDSPGQYISACEPSITLLSNGQMLAMVRTQYAHPPAEYKPMAVCWSDDQGKTWTKPVATEPHLMNISPTLATLDNGVVACQYGRPGFHVAFSLDNGQTWQDRISFSHQIEPTLTGQFDMIKSGPNNLIAIGSNADGVQVWPISVKRVAVSPARVALAGRVIDERGRPIADALVERGPNRYSVGDWVVDPLGWSKRVRRGNLHPERIVPSEYIPKLSYRSIQEINGYPTVRTDKQGRYVFEDVDLGEYVLTVEADGHAPKHRHIQVGLQSKSEDFSLKPGRLVRGRVVNAAGQPIGGVCVVLNQWHCHTDPRGVFHWSVKSPAPQQVTVHIYKRYNSQYGETKATVTLSQLEDPPIILKHR